MLFQLLSTSIERKVITRDIILKEKNAITDELIF